MTLVGLVGAKRAGKDSVAAALVEQLGYRRYAFADALKELAVSIDPMLDEIVAGEGWEAAKEVDWVRAFLQTVGVAVRDHVNEDVWANVVARKLFEQDPERAVITDVRFPNEVEMIRRRGGYIVRVDRPGIDESDAHVSEQLYREVRVDVAIENSGSLDALAHRAVAVATALEQRDAALVKPAQQQHRDSIRRLASKLDALSSHGIGGKWARASEDGALL